jgi:hypothetical protein
VGHPLGAAAAAVATGTVNWAAAADGNDEDVNNDCTWYEEDQGQPLGAAAAAVATAGTVQQQALGSSSSRTSAGCRNSRSVQIHQGTTQQGIAYCGLGFVTSFCHPACRHVRLDEMGQRRPRLLVLIADRTNIHPGCKAAMQQLRSLVGKPHNEYVRCPDSDHEDVQRDCRWYAGIWVALADGADGLFW